MSDNYWLTEWQLATYSICEINELFLLPIEPRKSPSNYGFWPQVDIKSVSSHVFLTSLQCSFSQDMKPNFSSINHMIWYIHRYFSLSFQLKDKFDNLLYFSYCQQMENQTNDELTWKTNVCTSKALYPRAPLLSKNTSVSYSVALGDMYLHYYEHGHCSFDSVQHTPSCCCI